MIEDKPSDEREELEKHADRVRSRLAATLETLDRRRRDIVHRLSPREMVRARLPRIVAAGAASVAALIGVGIYSLVRARSRSTRMFRERWQAVGRAWRHPERLVRNERPSFAMEMGRRIVGGLLGLAITVLSRRIAARRELPAESAPG